jgi:hypothetical protein
MVDYCRDDAVARSLRFFAGGLEDAGEKGLSWTDIKVSGTLMRSVTSSQ